MILNSYSIDIRKESNINRISEVASTRLQRRIYDASTSLRRLPLRLTIHHLIGAVVQEGIHIDVRGVAVEAVGVFLSGNAVRIAAARLTGAGQQTS